VESCFGTPNSENGSIDDKLDELAESIRNLPDNRKEELEKLMKKRLFDSLEACAILGISLPTLRRAIKRGEVKTVRLNKFLRIPSEEIDRLMHGQEEQLLTVQQASEILCVGEGSIRNLINAGKIKASRLTDSGPFKIPRSEIDRICSEGI